MLKNILFKYLRQFPLEQGKHKVAKNLDLSQVPRPIIHTNANGIALELNVDEYIMRQIFLFDGYEKYIIRHLIKLAKPNMTFIDVGTHIGFYSLTMANFLPQGKVHAFEPNPYTLSLLHRNVELNPTLSPRIKVNPFGLSDQNEQIEIFYHKGNLGTSSIYNTSAGLSETVNLTTLDQYCTQNNIQQVDMIKVDIEGAELKFLKGAQNIINNSPKLLLAVEIIEENCRKAGYSAKELYEYIISFGFKPFVPRGWPFSLTPIDLKPDENFYHTLIFLKGYE